MKIAAAQTRPFHNNTEANLQSHYRLIELAAKNGARVIVFPEMSLTGYERELASDLAFSENDIRLNTLKEMAALYDIMIIAGAPIRIASQLHIGSFIFLPGNTSTIYTKQFLHQGEENFFSPSFNFNPAIDFANEKISFAICSDIANPLHPANANNDKTTLYIASLFYLQGGINNAYSQLSSYAEKYSMNILMANYGGPSYIYQSAGKSAFWNKKGELIGKMDENSEGLLVMEKNNDSWIEKVVVM